jgi:hypothetical protein
MTSTDSRARNSRARAVRRPRVARGDAPASAEVARGRCSRWGGTDARGRDNRLGTIERADPDADPRGEPDATLHRGKRTRRMVLTLRALRRVVDAGALCGMVRLQGRRRDPDFTGMGERGGRVGRDLHAEQRARADAPPRSGGQHSSGQRHHRSAAEAGRRRSIRRLCRIQFVPLGSLYNLNGFLLRPTLAECGRREPSPATCYPAAYRSGPRRGKTGLVRVTSRRRGR